MGTQGVGNAGQAGCTRMTQGARTPRTRTSEEARPPLLSYALIACTAGPATVCPLSKDVYTSLCGRKPHKCPLTLQVITWQQLGFHRKPIGLLNACGFFDPLVAFFQHCVKEVGRGGFRLGGAR